MIFRALLKEAGLLHNLRLGSNLFQIQFYNKTFSVLLQFWKEECLVVESFWLYVQIRCLLLYT